MFNITKETIEWGGKPLTLETGKVARQADGAVMATYGETVVLCTAVAAKKAKEGIDFFPLTIHYQEKAYAAGKIPGGFFKREGRPAEKEVLTSRLIDRPIRPLFPKGFRNETQVICTVLSHDGETDPDIVAMIGASAALSISGIPFQGPIAAARVGYKDGEYLLNPDIFELEDSQLDLVVAATKDSVMMVESEADCLPEDVMLGAVNFGHDQMQPVIALINKFKDDAGKPVWEVAKEDKSALAKKVADVAAKAIEEAYAIQAKQERSERLSNIKAETVEKLTAEDETLASNDIEAQIKDLEKDIVRGKLLKEGIRIDGRDKATVRPIVAEVGILPRVHGTALFTRGETQSIVAATLGTSQDEQIIDSLEGDSKQHFLLHYNFPPFSVGEATPMRPPGRREIGHGKLAWRALRALLPSREDFPYTIRLVSEITESNGSSSMATVCGSSLAMMDAGVPLKAPVAGIAMGLVKEGDDYIVLSDIMGDEDHLGDMDFKVAGTKDGITALQMDIKIDGITREIMQDALAQAQGGRLHILDKMAEALTTARDGVNENAPTITTMKIAQDKIRDVIGSGGKVIRELCETTGSKIDIADDGTITIAAVGKEATDNTIKAIKDIVAEVEIGKIYTGKVARVVDFGAFVTVIGKQDGLVHVSEITGERIENVSDVLNEGDEVKVKVLAVERGKIRLSMRVVDQNTGEEIEGADTGDNERGNRSNRNDRGDRGGRGGDRRGGGRANDNRGDRRGGGSRDRNDRPRRDDRNDDNRNDAPAPRQEEAEEKPKKKKRFFGQF